MNFDVIVIGSGPGGYVCAIRSAQLGYKTALVEKESSLGGTCLNVGCIPSKALLDSSEHYHQAKTSFAQHGIMLKDLSVDMNRMIDRKNEVVDQTVKGIEFLMKKNKIEVFEGTGSFVSSKTILVKGEKEETKIDGRHIVIATGSQASLPPAFAYDGKRIISSTEALEIRKVPKKLVVVGGGVIGLELGSVYARLGTEVHVVEFLDRIIATMDRDCGRELTRSLKKLGMKFYLKHAVTSVKASARAVSVDVQKRDSEESFKLSADYCLVAIGRVPFTDKLGLENTGIRLDKAGRIQVNEHLETDEKGVYAIGDVVRGAMLAHKAEEEGILVAETIAGQRPHVDYNLIPNVVYTWPEVAGVGQTEDQLKESGIPFKKGKFPIRALGRARASMDIEGMVKILSHRETDEVLGVHMVGPRAADMIAEAVAVMEYRGSAEDIARMSHAHPTYTEAIKEAALDASDSRAIHM